MRRHRPHGRCYGMYVLRYVCSTVHAVDGPDGNAARVGAQRALLQQNWAQHACGRPDHTRSAGMLTSKMTGEPTATVLSCSSKETPAPSAWPLSETTRWPTAKPPLRWA